MKKMNWVLVTATIGLVIGFVVTTFLGSYLTSGVRNPEPGLGLSSVRLQTMESLAEAYGNRTSGVYGVYQVGLTYSEGDVAYFWGSHQDWTIQLEEWRDDGRRNFRVNTWVFTPRDVRHWAFTVTPTNGMVVKTPNDLVPKTLDVRASEVEAKFVGAQKLLLGSEFDNPRPFKSYRPSN